MTVSCAGLRDSCYLVRSSSRCRNGLMENFGRSETWWLFKTTSLKPVSVPWLRPTNASALKEESCYWTMWHKCQGLGKHHCVNSLLRLNSTELDSADRFLSFSLWLCFSSKWAFVTQTKKWQRPTEQQFTLNTLNSVTISLQWGFVTEGNLRLQEFGIALRMSCNWV